MSVKVEGFSEFGGRLRRLAAGSGNPGVDAIVLRAAQDWEGKAKKSAPVNFGKLRGSITSSLVSKGVAEVTVNSKYAPYMEWGTIQKVSVPSDLSNYAIQFKGKGIRKTGGVTPRPFFFIHKATITQQLNKMLEDFLK